MCITTAQLDKLSASLCMKHAGKQSEHLIFTLTGGCGPFNDVEVGRQVV